MREAIQKILETAVYAPSGDNSQPWRFEVLNNQIDIYSQPEKDNPRFNYRERGTFIAHGALAENITIAAQELGYRADVNAFPKPGNLKHTYRIILNPQATQPHPLFRFIKLRQTNRNFYRDEALQPSHKQALLKTAAESGGNLILIEDEVNKKTIGTAVAANEIVMLENKEIHDLFYADIRWTTSSERRLKTGLYLKTMELPPPKLAFFKLLQWWPAARVLNKLGMARFIAKDNAKQYSSASAIGLLSVPNEDRSFLEAGQAMQRIWLTATKNGVSMHPVTGVIYLAQRITAGETSGFSAEHVTIVREAYDKIIAAAGAPGPFAMLFRIGYGKKPGGVQSRLQPEIKYL